MNVIGIAGQARMGKDTIADYLQMKIGGDWNRTAFAKGVKRVFGETFDWDYGKIEEWKVNPNPPPGFDMNIRKALQFIGDGFRQIKADIWIELALRGTENRIISDVRYVNEFLAIKRAGGINILVGREDQLNDDPNASEAQIKPYVEWALKNMKEGIVERSFILEAKYVSWGAPSPPQYMDQFDLFINNNGTLEDLYRKLDTIVIPYIIQAYTKE